MKTLIVIFSLGLLHAFEVPSLKTLANTAILQWQASIPENLPLAGFTKIFDPKNELKRFFQLISQVYPADSISTNLDATRVEIGTVKEITFFSPAQILALGYNPNLKHLSIRNAIFSIRTVKLFEKAISNWNSLESISISMNFQRFNPFDQGEAVELFGQALLRANVKELNFVHTCSKVICVIARIMRNALASLSVTVVPEGHRLIKLFSQCEFPFLESLKVQWCYLWRGKDQFSNGNCLEISDYSCFLESVELPPNLRHLSLSGTDFLKNKVAFKRSMGNLSKLQKLKLGPFTKDEWIGFLSKEMVLLPSCVEFSLVEFPSLCSLVEIFQEKRFDQLIFHVPEFSENIELPHLESAKGFPRILHLRTDPSAPLDGIKVNLLLESILPLPDWELEELQIKNEQISNILIEIISELPHLQRLTIRIPLGKADFFSNQLKAEGKFRYLTHLTLSGAACYNDSLLSFEFLDLSECKLVQEEDIISIIASSSSKIVHLCINCLTTKILSLFSRQTKIKKLGYRKDLSKIKFFSFRNAYLME